MPPVNISKVKATEAMACAGIAGIFLVGACQFLANRTGRQGRTTCQSNMKQIGASLLMYAADYDGTLPRTTEEKPSRGFGNHWTYLVQPYVRSSAVFVCPDRPDQPFYLTKGTDTTKRVPKIGYINNYAVLPPHDFYPVPFSTFTDPAGLIMIGERRSITDHVRIGGWKGTSAFSPGEPCAKLEFGADYRRTNPQEAEAMVHAAQTDKDLLMIRVDWAAHGDGSNYLFADGHSAYQSLSRTLDPQAFEWGERFYPRNMPNGKCDSKPADTL